MKTIAIDTNLLLLLVVGRAAASLLGSHKRLKAYSAQDFELLASVLERARTILVTPNAMTEVSNLVAQGVDKSLRIEIIKTLKHFIAEAAETYHPSTAISSDQDFGRLGLTDCAWLAVLQPDVPFLTEDLDLYNTAKSRGLQAYNFNHLREERSFI